LIEHTGNVLSEWIQERRHLEAYDGTTGLWLNNADNPYKSASLCYLVRQFCDEADIPRENRKIVWYTLRHDLGKSMEEEDSLPQASNQLRHSSMETTKGTYAKSSIESRRNTLEKINDRAKRTAEGPDFNPYWDEDSSTSVTSSTASQSQTSQPSSSGTHINAGIRDTTEARSKLAQPILSGEEIDESYQGSVYISVYSVDHMSP
jgi:hypothetical protein